MAELGSSEKFEMQSGKRSRNTCDHFAAVEIAIRMAIIMFTIVTLACAIVVIVTYESVRDTALDNVGSGNFGEEAKKLIDNTRGTGGWIVVMGFLVLVLEVVIIVLRCLETVRVLTSESIMFRILDIVFSSVASIGFLGGVAGSILYAIRWANRIEKTERLHLGGLGIVEDFEQIRDGLIASSVFCFIVSVLFAILAAMMVVYLFSKKTDYKYKLVKQ